MSNDTSDNKQLARDDNDHGPDLAATASSTVSSTVSSTASSADSVADHVNSHLQALETKGQAAQRRQLSPEEQLFTEDELARLVNPDKLKALMSNGDDFLGYLTGEINKFED
ncbi:hypothetical protein [Psychrobacter sanguinis]|uniref:Uncharacterized protein n=1 Tax=Psychrobacter sanguinis TaxID=861445 RepID=A0A844M1S8_9GAMM|nr:hypothetical protein [Psychrobacter sanguinis]MUG32902.1 hypothetical protein [Psychrobacter sanguinis]